MEAEEWWGLLETVTLAMESVYLYRVMECSDRTFDPRPWTCWKPF